MNVYKVFFNGRYIVCPYTNKFLSRNELQTSKAEIEEANTLV